MITEDEYDESWRRLPRERIQLHVPELLDAVAALPDRPVPANDPQYPYVLSAGERRAFTANTIIRDPEWRRRDPDGRLRMSDTDAERLGVSSGDHVRLTTRAGSADVQVDVTDTMRAGHLALPNGLGLTVDDPAGDPVTTGVATNTLTDHQDRDEWGRDPLAQARPGLHRHHPGAGTAVARHATKDSVSWSLSNSRPMATVSLPAQLARTASGGGVFAAVTAGVEPWGPARVGHRPAGHALNAASASPVADLQPANRGKAAVRSWVRHRTWCWSALEVLHTAAYRARFCVLAEQSGSLLRAAGSGSDESTSGVLSWARERTTSTPQSACFVTCSGWNQRSPIQAGQVSTCRRESGICWRCSAGATLTRGSFPRSSKVEF